MADGHPFIWHELVTPDQASSGIIESLSAAQRELWAQACGLWEQSRGGDRAGIRARLHPDYVGWDLSADLPHDRDAAVASVTADAPALKDYELFPHSVQVYDDLVGVVHYSYRATVLPRAGAPLVVTGKWTEVYLRQGKEWTMVSVTGLPKPATSWPQGGTG
ncbi:MAG TPA: nuclear transport factor 2 family protein [Ramlibacter sp.]